jgi:sugar phosphate isomerase/epimerase
MRIAFEPLNPVLFNTDTALWGLDDGLELVRRVDVPNVGLCLDTWNVFQTPDLPDVIRACGERIFVVQISDWQRPRSGADRRCLGDGTIPTVSIVKAIRETGYDGPYVLEIFSGESLPGSLWRGDMGAMLLKNSAAFANVWEQSAQ